MSRALVARAPTRLDFGGGWTDVPPYSQEQGGAVCNLAITHYATATVAVVGHAAPHRDPGTGGNDPLIAAALRRGGVTGAEASVVSDFPVGAGLGGSSAAGVALAGALATLAGRPLDRASLAALSRATEVGDLGVAGGFQDHYAAAFGGASLMTFGADVDVEPIALAPDACDALARRALLIYTGESRLSSATIDAVLDAYRDRVPRVRDALARMKALAHEMAAALRGADVDGLGRLIGEHWLHQRALHPSITTARIDEIMAVAARHGGIGGKALGASGGGCVVVFAADGREDELASVLAPFGERMRWSIDTAGFDVVAAMNEEHAAERGEV